MQVACRRMAQCLSRILHRLAMYRSRLQTAIWLCGGYDPARYWRARGRQYIDEFERHDQETATVFDQQERLLLDSLSKLLITSALELGCGFGRILKLLSDNFLLRRLEGVDVSPDQILHAKEFVSCPRVHFEVGDITAPLKYHDGEFDLVLTCEVLMHIPEPLPVLREMLRVSGRYVVNLEYFDPLARTPRPWCFNHDLLRMYHILSKEYPLGFQIDTIQLPKNQRMILVTKK